MNLTILGTSYKGNQTVICLYLYNAYWWRRKWQPTPVCLPGEFHGQRSLVGYSPWGHRESDMTEQLRLSQNWPQDWKRSVFIPIPNKGNAKQCSNYCIVALISHASKIMLKILQAKLQQYVNQELPDVQAGFRKAEEPEIKLPTYTRS